MKNPQRGPIAWMAHNSVTANIIMMLLLVGGGIKLTQVKQEIFPEFTLDFVSVSIPYPSASPAEIESGIILALEEALRGIDGVKHVNTTAYEGMGNANIELTFGADAEKALADIKSAIDQIRSFPKEAEKASVKRISARNEVISLVVYGQVDDAILRQETERARDELLASNKITLADLVGAKNREISIELSQQSLEAHNLSLGKLAQNIAQSSVEIPAGQLRTSAQELALRTNDKRDAGEDYHDLIIKGTSQGEQLRLGDIASIHDGFEESERFALYNGQPAMMLRIFRTGEQRPLDIAETVKNYAKEFSKTLPAGVSCSIWNDYSAFLKGRIDLLKQDTISGLILVLISLALFLNLRLAFWVASDIPTSFLGSFLLLSLVGMSINMITLFAFIIVLGMVVDDAIVVGENVYERRANGEDPLSASINGAKDVLVPVVFSVLTVMAAFMPLMFVPGMMGKFFYFVPIIVCTVMLISLFETFFILPGHLAHAKTGEHDRGILGVFYKRQQAISAGFIAWINKYYRPSVYIAVKHRYLSLSIALSMFILIIGLIAGGRLGFVFFPKIDSDVILLHAEFDVGSPIEKSKQLEKNLISAAHKALDKLGGQDKAQGFFSQIGSSISLGGPVQEQGSSGSHIVEIMAYLVSSDLRQFSSDEFTALWQKELGDVAGIKSLIFKSTSGPTSGKPVSLQLKHQDLAILEKAALTLTEQLKNYAGLHSFDNGIIAGKEQLDFKLKDLAAGMNISTTDLGLELRHAFYGAEALRRQRGRDEVKVMVRLSKEERESLFDLENFRINTNNSQILLHEVAEIKHGSSYATISREDGARVITVSADILAGSANANNIMADIEAKIVPELKRSFPGLTVSRGGEQREQGDALKNLGLGALFSLMLIYALLAIPLKSYLQPLIVMSVIPYGLIGAALGHMVMGYDLNIISIMGLVALSGIVVNNSLVFVHLANDRAEKSSLITAIVDAGVRRFRPIFLTSVTTFLGLLPMIFETSMQARFLIPMAITIGFGVMFSTMVTLLLVPALYAIGYDLSHLSLFSKKIAVKNLS